MAVAFRSQANVAYASRAASTTINAPAGVANDDILICAFFNGFGSLYSGITAPAGWTQITGSPTQVHDVSFHAQFSVFWKRASSEGASYTFTHDFGRTYSTQGVILAYSGCEASGSPIDVSSVNTWNGTNNGTTPSVLGVTTTVANTQMVCAAHDWEGSGTLSPPTGYTERFDSLVYVSDKAQATAAATGNFSYTNGNPTNISPWSNFLVALKPATGAPTPINGTLAQTEANDTVAATATLAGFGAVVQSNTGSSSTATTTPTLSGSRVAGNLLVLTFAADDYNGTVSSGWTQSTGMEQQTFHGGYIWWRIVASGGEAINPYVIGSASRSAWTLVEYEGPFDASPYDTSNGTFSSASGRSITSPSITPSTGDRMLVGGLNGQYGGNVDLGGAWTSITGGFTQRAFIQFTGANPTLIVGQYNQLVTGNGSTTYAVGGTQGATATDCNSRSGLVISFKKGAAGGAITGTAAITEASDTVAGVANLRLAGTASIAEASDTVASTATLPLVATLARTESDDTVIATGAGAAANNGTAAITEADDTSTATGTLPLVGTAAISEADDTLVATSTNLAASTPTLFGTGFGTTSVAVTGTPAAGATLFAFLNAFDAALPAVTGEMSISDTSGQNNADTGTTAWVEVGFWPYETTVNRRQASKLYRKRFATSPGSITINGVCTNQNDCTLAVASVVVPAGFATITNIASGTNAAGDPSMTITTPVSTSLVMAFANGQGNNSFGAVTGFTELSDANWSSADNRRGVIAYDAAPAVATYNPVSTNTHTLGILLELVESSGVAAITGTAAITEADDTVAASATLPLAATAAITEQGDTAQGAAGLIIYGQLLRIEADDAAAGVANLRLVASAAVTEGNDTVAATGSLPLVAALSRTEDGDTLLSSGTGSAVNAGQAAITEADDTLAATSVLVATRNATASITEQSDIAQGAAGLVLTATVAATEGDDTLAGLGNIRLVATLAVTEGNDSLTTVASLRLVGQLSRTEQNDTLAATGNFTILGQFAQTEAGDTLVSSGAASVPPLAIAAIDRTFTVKVEVRSATVKVEDRVEDSDAEQRYFEVAA